MGMHSIELTIESGCLVVRLRHDDDTGSYIESESRLSLSTIAAELAAERARPHPEPGSDKEG